MPKIFITGSIAFDYLLSYDGSFTESIKTDALKDLSLAFVTPHMEKQFGGTGANIAWNLKLLGGDPFLASSVGEDGKSYIERLSEFDIDTRAIEIVDNAITATAILATDTNEQHIIFFHPGADALGSWTNVNEYKDLASYAIVSPRDIPAMQKAFEWCLSSSIPVLFDPGQQISSFADDELNRMIEKSNSVIANSYEWKLISEKINSSPEEISKKIDFAIVTQGEDGADVYVKGDKTHVSACKPKKVINPTGAGDAFRAGLLYGLGNKLNLNESVKLGAAMGSFVVEITGTQLENFDRKMLEKRIEKTYGIN
ncbi:MAG: carbohydrate kinase family protein [Candidatus Peribacteraceae bacterium]|nr:carbohydrate kinase family protein [Candidatus Peribacteraceae bacterium]